MREFCGGWISHATRLVSSRTLARSATRDGDWLYGRGIADMKAGIAANIYAVDALKRLGYRPAATVYQQSVVEEECTGNGALAALLRGYNADAAIIPKPEDMVKNGLSAPLHDGAARYYKEKGWME